MQPSETRTMKVLIIEDDPLISDILKHLFTSQRNVCSVDRCVDLSSALAWLASHPVDVIILDLALPDSAGLDTLAAVCAVAPEPAIVVMTGTDDDRVAVAAIEQGAQDYVVKGRVPPYALARVLKYANARSQARRRAMVSRMAKGLIR